MQPTQQPYRSLDECVRMLRILLPKPRETWRLVKHPLCGEIQGIPNSRGLTIATNGIMVMLVSSGGLVTFGHLQWFIVDPTEDEVNILTTNLFDEFRSAKTATPKRCKELAKYYTW